MLKFNRRYKADFIIGTYDKQTGKQVPQEAFTVEYPFSCNFMIDLGIYSSANRAHFQFYNLPKDIQGNIWYDVYESGKKYVDIIFYAGYEDNLALLFSGRCQQSLSYRQSGSVDYISDISAFNAGNFYQYGYANETFTQGTTLDVILDKLLEETGVKLGYISPEINVPLQRDKTFIGQTWNLLLREFSGYNIFIDNNELNIIGENEVVPGEVLVISDSSGLLGSPRRANSFTELDMVFEPQLRVGQAVDLQSYSMPQFNRAYQVVTIKHKGMISPRVCGKLITTPTLSMFAQKPKKLEKTKQIVYEGTPTISNWIKPIEAAIGKLSSPFGMRLHPILKKNILHTGVDIAAPLNTPVYATANGIVRSASMVGGYGNSVEIDNGTLNGKKISTFFAHLNSFAVSAKQEITAGDIIGYVGSTGTYKNGKKASTAPHLHFGVKENGAWVNPTPFIGSYG